MNEQFLYADVKLQATSQLFHHGSTGHWQWPMTRGKTHPKMVTHLTHDPWPTDPFTPLLYTAIHAVDHGLAPSYIWVTLLVQRVLASIRHRTNMSVSASLVGASAEIFSAGLGPPPSRRDDGSARGRFLWSVARRCRPGGWCRAASCWICSIMRLEQHRRRCLDDPNDAS